VRGDHEERDVRREQQIRKRQMDRHVGGCEKHAPARQGDLARPRDEALSELPPDQGEGADAHGDRSDEEHRGPRVGRPGEHFHQARRDEKHHRPERDLPRSSFEHDGKKDAGEGRVGRRPFRAIGVTKRAERVAHRAERQNGIDQRREIIFGERAAVRER
jgi:hypothetical protein